MGKLIGGGNVKLYYGANNITSYFNTASLNRANELQDTTTFEDTAREYSKGLDDGTVTLTGLYDDVAGNVDAILNTAFAASAGTNLTIGPALDTIGRAAHLLVSRKSRYSIPVRVGEIIGLEAEIQADGGIDRGRWLHALGAETGIVNSASIDDTAGTTNGGVAHLHVTAATVTTVTIKVQHSTDNAIWADLVTFTAVAGTTNERVVVAAGTTVNRYLRAIISAFTGTTVTYAVAFARR